MLGILYAFVAVLILILLECYFFVCKEYLCRKVCGKVQNAARAWNPQKEFFKCIPQADREWLIAEEEYMRSEYGL